MCLPLFFVSVFAEDKSKRGSFREEKENSKGSNSFL